MRVAVNTRFLLPSKLEGLGWYTHEVVSRLVAQHPDWEFVFLFDRAFDPRFVYGPNVRPLVLFPPARHAVLWYAWFEWAVPRALRQVKADVFFSPDSYLSLSAPTRTVLTIHDVIPLQMPEQVPLTPRLYYQHYLPRFAQRADRVVAVSEFTARSIADTCGISTQKITVAHNGCREGFTPLPPEQQQVVREQYAGGAPYFLYTGSIHARKNVHRLIRAFDQFKSQTGSPARLLLVGRFMWEQGEVKTAYEQARHREHIQFLGYVPEADLYRLMGGALALTYVSLSEGFGLPVVEAFYCDTPVLCSNTTALPEVAGDAAVLVNPTDEAAIVLGMQRLWGDEALRNTLVERGRVQRQSFSWDRAAEVVAGLF